MFGQRMTFLVGPEAHTPFFAKGDAELSQDEPYRFSVPIFGNGVVYDADLLHRKQQLKVRLSSPLPALHMHYKSILLHSTNYYTPFD